MTQYSRKKALFIIVISTLLVSGSAAAALLFFHLQEILHSKSALYRISTIVQVCPRYEALKSSYLAEVLGLSIDQPTNITLFDTKDGEEKLLKTHVIEKAVVKKIKPHTILVDYQVREPLFSLFDLTNTYLDKKGTLFPAFPFYSPKTLPELYLGQKEWRWGMTIPTEKLEKATEILGKLSSMKVVRIDLSSIDAGLGRKEMVVIVKRGKVTHTLRLPVKGYEHQLDNYFLMVNALEENQSLVVDLRLSDLAFLKMTDKG